MSLDCANGCTHAFDGGTVLALDAATGDYRREFGTEGDVRTALHDADGTVFVGSGDGAVDAIDGEAGTVLWKRERYCGGTGLTTPRSHP